MMQSDDVCRAGLVDAPSACILCSEYGIRIPVVGTRSHARRCIQEQVSKVVGAVPENIRFIPLIIDSVPSPVF